MNPTITKKNSKKNTRFLGRKFAARHRARELAIQFLYAVEMRPEQDIENSLGLFLDSIGQNLDSDFDSESHDENSGIKKSRANKKSVSESNKTDSKSEPELDPEEIKKFCKSLVLDVYENSQEIDAVLLQALTGWRPERMVSVDRAVLRLIISEAFLKKTLPLKSAMTEAAILADNFGTKDSARFVNGVLAKIFKLLPQDDEAEKTE